MIEGDARAWNWRNGCKLSRKPIAEAKRALIHDHVDHCLEAAVGQVGRKQRTTIEEFKAITRLPVGTA
jgi:DNA-binding FrmR family transcriptional regulator